MVLETYGTGNGPDSRADLLHEIQLAAARGVIIMNCTQCLYGHVIDSYASGKVGWSMIELSQVKSSQVKQV